MDDDLERLYELLYLLPVGVVSFDTEGTVEAANPLAVQLLNPFVEPGATGDAFRLLAPLVSDLATLLDERAGEKVVLARQRTTLRRPDGPVSTVELAIHRPRPGLHVAVLSDVTELVRQEQELRRERDRIRVIVETVREYAIYALDRDGRVDSWNASGERLFGLSSVDAMGQTLAQLVVLEDEGTERALEEAVFAGWRRLEGWSTGADGVLFYTDTMISTLVDGSGHPDGFVVITRDATEARLREESLRREADTDPLTSLANRRGFDARAVRLVAACEVNGVPASVLMLDIDHFKAVNDTFGHDGGDIVLRAFAETVAAAVRSLDIVGRLGGEEFAVLLPGADVDAAARTAEAIRAKVEQLHIEVAPGTSAPVTVSIGVAPLDGDLAGALGRADDALYRAKAGGRNRVVLHTDTGDVDRTG